MKKSRMIVKLMGVVLIFLALLLNPFFIKPRLTVMSIIILSVDCLMVSIGLYMCIKPSRIIHYRKEIILSIFIILFSISIIELFLQIINYPPFFETDTFTQCDEELGWKLIPNKTGFNRHIEFEAFERVNSKGLRGEEHNYTSKKKRILFLGDSMTEGYVVNYEAHFSQLLRDMLNDEYEMINMGVRGYNTAQEYLSYIKEGRKYNADIVILLFIGTDSWWLNRDMYEHCLYSPTVLPKMKLWTLFYRGLKNLFSTEKDIMDLEVYKKNYNEEMIYLWNLTEEYLTDLNDVVTSDKGKLVVFYTPIIQEVYEEKWEGFVKKYNLNENEWDVNKGEKEFAKICKQNNLNCIIPIQRFKQEEQILYHPIDCHWNELGNVIAAEEMYKYLVDNDLVIN